MSASHRRLVWDIESQSWFNQTPRESLTPQDITEELDWRASVKKRYDHLRSEGVSTTSTSTKEAK